MKIVLGFLSTLFVSLNLFASMQDDFSALRDSGAKYEVIGTVCEQVARLRMMIEFPPPQYTVVTGIAYGDGHRTIGELDVIVFEGKNQRAIKVGEVKCWNDMTGGLNKAHDQRSRFLKAIGGKQRLYFESTDDHRQYGQDQFEGVHDFITIAQKGSKAVGYDRELDMTLSELMQLRSMMLDCQAKGACTAAR